MWINEISHTVFWLVHKSYSTLVSYLSVTQNNIMNDNVPYIYDWQGNSFTYLLKSGKILEDCESRAEHLPLCVILMSEIGGELIMHEITEQVISLLGPRLNYHGFPLTVDDIACYILKDDWVESSVNTIEVIDSHGNNHFFGASEVYLPV